MNCKWCGKEVDQNSKFCPNCGREILGDNVNNINQNVSDINPEEKLGNLTQEDQNLNQERINNVEEKVNVWLAILSYFVPIAGLIIFLVKKDKEPKTAKASGICALVSFIINMILIVVIFLFMSFVASKSTELINNTIDKADDIIEKTEEKQKDKDYNSNEASNTWSDYEVSVNNKTIKLPCTYEELKDATGFSMKSANEKSYLTKNYYATVNLYKNDKLALYTEIYNDTNDDIKYSDGKVSRISQTKYQVSTGADVITFPGSLKAGDQISVDELINKLGNPSDKSEYNDSSYNSITLTYNENLSWKTTKFYKITLVNGVIDELSLDNRK